ncbi:MAG: glycosyltransferase family 2 protein [Lachnospiraceae bacterium]|nr:glycosyltransferase family 2 protein [Lachnospiraceae bacterium]
MHDLVSIIMPSYNTAKYISETIESVQKQTYPHWELIIVDDCSTDSTGEVIEPFLKDTRISYYKNNKNSGAAVSRNRALQKATGRWIAFLDSDDLWLPDKLKNQIDFMLKKPCSFSYTEYEEIDEADRSLGVRVSGPQRITKIGMYNYCWPGCLTVMYDRNVVGDIRIVDIKKNNDYAMWLKICRKSDCYLYKKVMAKYRKRNGSISNRGYGELIKWHYRLFKEADGKNGLVSFFLTVRNLLFGFCKKLKYKKKV